MRKAKNFCKGCGGCCGPVPITAKEKEVILKYMQDNKYDFKSTNFPGGGTQLQDKLYDWVKKANNHS